MIGSLGFTEIAFILVLALLIFGPKRLPEIGRMVGKGLGEFRRASNDLKRTFNAELSLEDDEDRPKLPRTPRSGPKMTETGKATATPGEGRGDGSATEVVPRGSTSSFDDTSSSSETTSSNDAISPSEPPSHSEPADSEEGTDPPRED